jgi:outer membrane PBP1 activator LpoA protein
LPPISDEAVVEALATIDQATPAQVQAIVTELLAFALTPDQAVSIASEPAVLAVLSNDEATQVFEQVAVEELTSEQAAQFVEAVANAPTEVRQAFESVLNVFQGFADNYVMLNQTVPIKTRRALIALGAVFLVSAPAPTRRNRR